MSLPINNGNRKGSASLRLRMAVIGCDGYGLKVLQRALRMPEMFEITAGVSLTPDSPGCDTCRAYGIPVFDSIGKLLEAESALPHVVVNATPIPVHGMTTLQCLERGITVWLEKPAISGLAEFDCFAKEVESMNGSVEVCYNALHQPNIGRLREQIQRGDFGRLLRIDAVGAFFRDHDYFNRASWTGKIYSSTTPVFDGSLNNTFSHLLSTGLYLGAPEYRLFAEAALLKARLWHLNEIESEDTSSVVFRLGKNIDFTLNLTLCAEEEIPSRLRFTFDRSTVEIANYSKISVRTGTNVIDEWAADEDLATRSLMELHSAFIQRRTLCPLVECRPLVDIVEKTFLTILEANGGTIPRWPGKIEIAGDGSRVIPGSKALFQKAFDSGNQILPDVSVFELIGDGSIR